MFTKTTLLPLRCGPLGFHGELRYSSADPHQVTLHITDGRRTIVWEFARELLRDGLRAPAGVGDVLVWPGPHPSRVQIRLRSERSDVTFVAAKMLVAAFVDAVYTAVPDGQEDQHIDLDAEINQLLEA